MAPRTHDVAIIGMSCRLPGPANDLDSLWDFCERARYSAGPIPESRFNAAQYYHPDRTKKGHLFTEAGSYLQQDVGAFDAPFFNIGEAEAKSLDPQHRLMLETAFLALENAGLNLASISGRGDVGVFAAGGMAEYEDRYKLDPYHAPVYAAPSSAGTMFANRVSYFFNLKGPSLSIDTACSSALTALHLAVESITRGECSIAIVGGACLQLSPHIISFFSNLGTLDKRGISYSFDHRAKGYGRGEGAVCIVLKAHDAAIQDHDCVRALVRGTGINHGGRSQGITLPDGQSQADLIARVYENAGLDPRDTDYLEAHGTGTERGDPIEAESIAVGLRTRERAPDNPLYVGSAKSNFGHLEFVSGLVAILKCVAMLERDAILPSANFEMANRAIDLDDLNLTVPTKCVPWPRNLRRASINNFGFGGSNSHIILERPASAAKPLGAQQNTTLPTTEQPQQRLVVLSAKDQTSLESNIQALSEWLPGKASSNSFMESLSYTLCCRRTQFPYQFATYAATSTGLLQKLQSVVKTGRLQNSNKLVLIFTGQGAQWPQMGIGLMRYSAFANTFGAAEKYEVSKSAESSSIGDAILSQPSVNALQISLLALMSNWNIRPAAVCGHSSGEIAAAFAAGILGLEACMALAYYRGEASSQLADSDPPGTMMAVGASPAFIEPYLASLRSGLAIIACYNSPESVTVSGDRPAIIELSSMLTTAGTFHRVLKVGVAYHSDHMSAISEFYLQRIKRVLAKTQVPSTSTRFFSSVSGRCEPGSVVASPWYWVANLVCPVQFSKAVSSLLFDIGTTDPLSFVEIGPHSALQGPLRDIAKGHGRAQGSFGAHTPGYFPSLKRNEDPSANMLELAASLLIQGFSLETAAIFNSISEKAAPELLTDLPEYRFNKSRRYWHETRLTEEAFHQGSAWHMLLGHKITGTVGDTLEFRNVFSPDEMPWLRDHQVNGETLFPAAGYFSMAIEAVRYSRKDERQSIDGYSIRETTIGMALRLPEGTRNELFTILRPRISATRTSDTSGWFSFQVLSWTKENGFSEHCTGLIKATSGDKTDEISRSSLPVTRQKWVDQLLRRVEASSGRDVSGKELYQKLKAVGLTYGPAFARVTKLRTGDDCAVATVISQNDLSSYMPLNASTSLMIDPTTLDALLHVGLCNLGGNRGDPNKVRAHVPTFMEELFISADFQQQSDVELQVYAHDITCEKMSRTSLCSLTCLDPGLQTPAIEIRGLKVFDVQEENRVASSADVINPLLVEWRDHPDFITSSCLDDWEDPEVDTAFAVAEAKALDQQAYHLFEWALTETKSVPPETSHLFLLWKWMRSVVAKVESDVKSPELQKWKAIRGAKRWEFVDEVASRSFQGELHARVGRQLPGILNQEVDAMAVLFQRDGLWRVYEESIFFSRSNRQLSQLVSLLGHHNPSLRVLEVGAGTGGLANQLLSTLSTGSGGRRYDVYDYTDISIGFFENARSKFEQFPGINFKKLDVSRDPAEQDFVESDYDLIVAMDVIHATPDVAESLRNMRKLLKPGGVLAMVELDNFKAHAFPFATLPGWWHKEDGPVLKEHEWDEILLESGYNGAEVAIGDFPNVGLHKLYWTTAASVESSLPEVHVLVNEGASPSSLAAEVCSEFEKAAGLRATTLPLTATAGVKGTFVLLDVAEKSFLNGMGSAEHEALKSLMNEAEGLLWVTRSANPESRFASGFVRALQQENPQLTMAVLHLDADCHDHSASSVLSLWKSLYGTPSKKTISEIEFREVNGRIQIPRLIPSEPLHKFIESETGSAPIKEQNLIQSGRPLELTIGTVGLFSSLFFQDSDVNATPLGEDEVLIQIEATGLNFKDVMIGLGSLPWQGLGREASGTVIAAGSRAQAGFPKGSRVLHWGDALLSSHARGNIDNVVKIPANLTFEEAASIPVVYTTAYESLVNLARLEEGERVLIHAAAGGVGQAAIMIAQWIGAEVFCTVGSTEKKNLIMELYNIPEDHIFSSRNPSFGQALLAMTQQAGVDVILNSLAGDMLRVTWQCTAKFGRFIDISKRDAVSNAFLEMAPFDRGVTYTALDLSIYPEEGKKGRTKLTRDVLKLFASRAVRAVHPINVVPVSDVESALRTMQMGKHTGKIVIRNSHDSVVKVRDTVPKPVKLRSDATYVITGGGGGIGQFLGRWFLENGARHIILASRSALTLQNSKPVQDLMKAANDLSGLVLPVACDVGSLADVQKMVDVAREKDMPPIKGVIHGAMVLRDAMFETTTLEEWQSVITPKAHGALNLHQALASEPLDFFICLSSLIGTLGNAGQTSYAGSNSFLDAFCQWRVNQGLPATSIALPGVSDVGYVAQRMAFDATATVSSGLYDFKVTGEQVGQLITMAMNFADLTSPVVAGLPGTATEQNACLQDSIMSHVRNEVAHKLSNGGAATQTRVGSSGSGEPMVDRDALLRATTIEEASKVVFQGMVLKIANDMMIAPQDIMPGSSLAQIGLDSLVAVEFRNWLAKELGAKVRVMDIINSKSITDLVALVVEQSPLLTRLHDNGVEEGLAEPNGV